MATWQFTLFLVPAAALTTPEDALPARIDVDRVRTEDWWANTAPPDGLVDQLDAMFPRRDSWSSGMLGWGTDDGNRVDLLVANGRIEEIQVRLDARSIDVGLLERISAVARYSHAVFVTEEGEVTRPVTTELMRELENSTARRFAVDPSVFLESLDRQERLP